MWRAPRAIMPVMLALAVSQLVSAYAWASSESEPTSDSGARASVPFVVLSDQRPPDPDYVRLHVALASIRLLGPPLTRPGRPSELHGFYKRPSDAARMFKVSTWGPITRDDAIRILRAHGHELQTCLRLTHRRSPAVSGWIKLAIHVSPAGHVDNVAVVAKHFGSGPLFRCVVRAHERWRFPEHDERSIVKTTWYLGLEPGTGSPQPPKAAR